MMDIDYSPEQSRNASDLRTLALDSIRPFAREAEDIGGVPAEVRTLLDRFGLAGADGFADSVDDPVAFCLAAESLAWGDTGIAYAWLASRQVAWIIAACGTPAQKAKWLPRFAADPFLPASLFLYEGRGLAPSELETEIRSEGNGLIINGAKSPVMYPATAAVSVIIGRDQDGKLAGVIAENLENAVTFRDTDGGRLALGACPSAIGASIDNLKVPADNALDGKGLARAVTVCRMAHASVCIGGAAAATRYAGEWAQQRIAFGKPLVAYQGVAFPLANLVMEADTARLALSQLLIGSSEDADLEDTANQIVAHANQLVSDAGREGIQMMGVHGVMTEHPQERFYRSAAVLASIDFDPLNNETILR